MWENTFRGRVACKNPWDSLCMINVVLNKYAPLKKVKKYKLRFKNKPWITSGIQKSIYIKNKLLKKFINKKDPQSKAIFHEQNKTYRNLLSTLMKQSTQNLYCTKYYIIHNYITVYKILYKIFWKQLE